MSERFERRLELFPDGTRFESRAGRRLLHIGRASLESLASEHGTPLYLFAEETLDERVAAYRRALAASYPAQAEITLAGKALLFLASAQWAARRGLWLDCTGAGEIAVAHAAGFPRERILVHGVNKSDEDLQAALVGAAVIVVDNLSELRRILQAGERMPQGLPALWLRLRPGVAVDTHAYRQTGQSDSKFGMAVGEAAEAVRLCQSAMVRVEGIHFHQGSHFHDVAPIAPGIDAVLDFVARLRADLGWVPDVISPGGGWGVPYHEDDLPHPTIEDYVDFVARHLVAGCRARDIPLPRLHVEPGRSLVAQSGVAVYRVGTVKRTETRRWLLIDGGMADNPRPALYGARYSALPVERRAGGSEPAWIGGPYCESGDVLIQDLLLPPVAEGDLIAVPMSGAYHINMQSNYNGARRPAILWLRNGKATLVQRRQSIQDLLQRDLALPNWP